MRTVEESEVEAGAETGMRRQEDIGAGVATTTVTVTVTVTETVTETVTVTEIVTETVTETETVTVTAVTVTEIEIEIETGTVIVIVIEIESGTVIVIVIVIVIVRGIGIAEESRTSIQGLGAEVGSREGSLLVGTRTPSKHCIKRAWGNYGTIPFMESIGHYGVISTLYRSGIVPQDR